MQVCAPHKFKRVEKFQLIFVHIIYDLRTNTAGEYKYIQPALGLRAEESGILKTYENGRY